MATLPGLTYSAPGVPIYQPFGGTGPGSQSTITGDIFFWVGSTNTLNQVAFDFTQPNQTTLVIDTDNGSSSQITTAIQMASNGDLTILNPGGVYFNSDLISTGLAVVSSISTTVLDIDGQTLTASPTELLLNGVPVATQSSLSSIGDWALEPAISTVQMAGFSMIDVPQITGIGNQLLLRASTTGPNLTLAYDALSAVSSQFIFDTGGGPLMRYRAGELTVSSIVASNVTAVTFTALSSISVVSTISSLVLEGNLIQTSTLFANAFLSTPDIEVSTINGAQFGNSSITVEVVGVSSLVANSISSIGAEIRQALFSTVQFNPSFNPSLDVNLGLGSLFGNLAGAAAGGLGVLVGGAALGTGIAALSQSRQTNYINSNAYELVNGTTQLQISTLGTSFSTVYRFVSSVAENVPGQEYFVSTIHSPGVAIRSLSDPLNTVSAPTSTIQSFGQWVALDANLPIPSTVSSFSQVFTSSLATSTVLTNAGTGVRGGAPFFNSGSGMSTLEVFEASAPQYSGALRANQINFSFAALTSNDFTQDVLLFSQGANNRLTTGGGRVVAYLSDIPSTVSSFQTASISSATISSVNGGIPYTTANPPPVAPTVSTFQTASISSATISSVNGGIPFTTANPPPVADTSSILVSSIGSIGNVSSIVIIPNNIASLSIDTLGRFTEIGRNFNLQAQSSSVLLAELLVDSTGAGGNGIFRLAGGIGNINASTIAMSTNQLQVDTISTNTVGVREIDFVGISTVTFSTTSTLGGQNQPAGRLIMAGNDLDLQQNDLWCQQVRLGANNLTNAPTEVAFYNSLGFIAGFNAAIQDRTVRVVSSLNSDRGGYLLDTQLNPPFFSSLGGVSSVLMSFFPSTINSTIGVSTITNITPPPYIASVYSSTNQLVAGANTSTTTTWNTTSVNLGGFTIGTSTIGVPVAGTYEVATSFQFDTSSGGANLVEFWLTKNGAAVPQTNSRVSVANNADNLGNVSIYNTAVAGDAYGWMFYSSDANMSATAVAAGATPAIPSVIVNVRRLG